MPRRADLGDAALLAHPLGERVEPEVAVRTAVERPLEEAPNDGVELGADPRHLALGDALAAQRAHEVVDPPRGDALHVRLLDHCEQGALGAPPGLEQGGEVAALAQLRDLQLDAAGARVPAPRPVAVTPGEARLAALAVAGAHLPGDLGLHHRLGQHRDRLAQEVDVTPGRLLAQQLQQVHALPDHRSPPSCSLDLHEDGAVVFYVHLCDTTSWDATSTGRARVAARLTATALPTLSVRALRDVPIPARLWDDELYRFARLIEAAEESRAAAIEAVRLRHDVVRDAIFAARSTPATTRTTSSRCCS